mgnify:CR=1 FL=1
MTPSHVAARGSVGRRSPDGRPERPRRWSSTSGCVIMSRAGSSAGSPAPNGHVVAGPGTRQWEGLSEPHRAGRCWSKAWGPERVSGRLSIGFPGNEFMWISPEALHHVLFIEGCGELKRDLVTCLRTGRVLRIPRQRSRDKPQGHVVADVVISERPAEADDRAGSGRWEGDLIIGTGRSAIGALVGRYSRATVLVRLPRLEGWGQSSPVENGPSLGGYGAAAMSTALAASVTGLPQQLRKTIIWGRGKELSVHAVFAFETGTRVCFADPHSLWQRLTNENTGGLLRQYFPEGTDLSSWTADGLEAVAHTLNNRPRKTHGLENTGGSARRATTIPGRNQCRNNRLNLPRAPRSPCQSGFPRQASLPRSGRSARAVTMLSRRRSTGCSKPRSSSPKLHGEALMRSSSPPRNGSTGSITDASTSTAATFRQ